MKPILFLLLSLPLCVLADGGLPNQPYIYVQGRAEIEKPADMVTLHFNLITRDADQAKANREIQANAAKILALLDARKIAAKDVVAENLKSEPEYENDETSLPNRGKLVGYKVTRPFHVKIRLIDVFPKLVDELLAVSGVEFAAIETGLLNEKEMRDQIWQQTLANAREQAEKTVKPIKMRIDSVFAVSPTAFPQIQREILGEVDRVIVTGAAPPMKPEEVSQYRLGAVAVSESVHVIYLISAAK
jgi:uncharacterized protein YggE